ncbi:hypothetical protein J6590_105136 [Homalodisca vitripennis]|nr:hypothetical protein J6590_105136 [Homalodisca vitripennis]
MWKRDRGLGVPHLVQQVEICALRAGLQLVESEDSLLRELSREAGWAGVTDCRRCHSKPETLGHVIVVCIAGKRARIERHNWVVAGIEPFSVGSSHSTHHRGPTQAI